jgi:ADP-heptose:LPS heptosyltransferase
MSHLINSIHENNPSSNISVLVFDEFKKSASIINHVKKVYTIPRKKIISYHKNDIYSDAWGLNKLTESLSSLEKTTWDRVVNYSNDRSSSYICSYIDFQQGHGEIAGTSFNLENNTQNYNDWQIIYNNTTDLISNSAFNINDLTHLMTDTAPVTAEDKLKTNANHNKTAFKNFNQIRKINQNKTNDVQIVGVQLKSSMASKDIPEEVLVNTIKKLHEDSRTIPILLHSPAEDEKEYTERINAEFGKKLITVESDIIALTSVLINIDVVITPDTLTKHMADNTDTPCIEVSLGPAPLFLQSSINQRSLVITLNPDTRNYESKEALSPIHFDSLNETLNNTIEHFLNPSIELDIPGPWAVFKPVKDRIGTTLMPIAGSINDQSEYTRFFTRGIVSQMLTGISFDITAFNDLDNPNLNQWVEDQKQSFTNISRTLLNTIRALHQMKTDQVNTNTFVECLDILFDHSKEETLARIPLLIFKSRLESLSSINKDQGVKEVNELLFTLKNDIQLIINELNKVGMDEEIAELQRTATGETNV